MEDREEPGSRESSDEELLETTRDGGTAAFGELYRRHGPALLAYAGRVGGPAEADDLVAHAVERTLNALRDGLGPRESFTAYVRLAIRNAFINQCRLEQQQRRSLVGSAESCLVGLDLGLAVVARVASSAETQLMTEIDAALVRAAVAELPAGWRHILVRIYFEDASWAEVAEELAIAPHAARQRCLRARRGLQRILVEVPGGFAA